MHASATHSATGSPRGTPPAVADASSDVIGQRHGVPLAPGADEGQPAVCPLAAPRQGSRLTALPREIVGEIAQHLPLSALAALARTSRSLNRGSAVEMTRSLIRHRATRVDCLEDFMAVLGAADAPAAADPSTVRGLGQDHRAESLTVMGYRIPLLGDDEQAQAIEHFTAAVSELHAPSPELSALAALATGERWGANLEAGRAAIDRGESPEFIRRYVATVGEVADLYRIGDYEADCIDFKRIDDCRNEAQTIIHVANAIDDVEFGALRAVAVASRMAGLGSEQIGRLLLAKDGQGITAVARAVSAWGTGVLLNFAAALSAAGITGPAAAASFQQLFQCGHGLLAHCVGRDRSLAPFSHFAEALAMVAVGPEDSENFLLARNDDGQTALDVAVFIGLPGAFTAFAQALQVLRIPRDRAQALLNGPADRTIGRSAEEMTLEAPADCSEDFLRANEILSNLS
jgi:hypothetical protein